MNESPNLFDLMSSFGRENEYERFTPTEISFYFFLLYRANSRYWVMPIKCETSYASKVLSVTPARIITARKGLYLRGLINYTQGIGKREAPLYNLIVDPKKWIQPVVKENHLQMHTMDKDTDRDNGNGNNRDCNTGNDRDCNTDKDNPYKIKNKIINTKNKKIKEEIDIFLLKEKFINDEIWLTQTKESLLSLFPFVSIEIIKTKLDTFFNYLETKGETKREENDCRNHFINWINLKLKTESYGNNNRQCDTRRGCDVTATSPEDYEGMF